MARTAIMSTSLLVVKFLPKFVNTILKTEGLSKQSQVLAVAKGIKMNLATRYCILLVHDL